MSAVSGSGVHVRGGGGGLVRPACAAGHQLNAVAALSRRGRAPRAFASKQRTVSLENRFVHGTKVRSGAGMERVQLWQTDGPGRAPKLRFVVKNSMSQVPEKPLGLYDPAFDKDSCGVGFVAELSGEGSRKTVLFWWLSNNLCVCICL